MSDDQDLSSFSMLDLFRIEVENQVLLLNQGLLALESDPGAKDKIEPLMRAAHSIKGAARIVQIDTAVKVAHAMEDCLVAAQKGDLILTSEHIDRLLKGVDFINRLSTIEEKNLEKFQSEQNESVGKLVTEIRSFDTVAEGTAAPKREEKAVVAETPPARPAAPVTAEVDAKSVRITAESMSRFMALAGESLVSSNALQPHVAAMRKLKDSHYQLSRKLERLEESVHRGQSDLITSVFHESLQNVEEVGRMIASNLEEIESFSRRSANLAGRLYRESIAGRMRPFADVVENFPRMVRDLARSLNKKVKLEMRGRNTKVDREILEKLESPLNHLLRNAVDHGLENPEQRTAAGKNAEGKLILEARHQAGMLLITVSDDGRGVDFEKLKQKIITKQLTTTEFAARLSEPELLEFLFLPGFTTTESVTEISGRGVGMDVVYTMVHEMGGTVKAHSQPGQGMTVNIQLPVTLSVIRTILVEIAGEIFAFPLARIERTLVVPRSESAPEVSGKPVFLVSAADLLEINSIEESKDQLPIVVIGDPVHRYGLIVDRFLGQKELVVRPLDSRLGKIRDVSAAATLEDGSPILILDVQDLVRSAEKIRTSDQAQTVSPATAVSRVARRKRILIVEDSLTVREVERKLLSGLGYDVETAVDGIDGWNAAGSSAFDLIISDVDMPRMNGIELVTRLKGDPKLKQIPVIIISYKDREEDRKRGLEAGAHFYLTKSSFQDETLIRSVLELIGEP